jgi:hypothetical protein
MHDNSPRPDHYFSLAYFAFSLLGAISSFPLVYTYAVNLAPRPWSFFGLPVVLYACGLAFYRKKHRRLAHWKLYALMGVAGFIVGYFLSYGLVFLFSLED